MTTADCTIPHQCRQRRRRTPTMSQSWASMHLAAAQHHALQSALHVELAGAQSDLSWLHVHMLEGAEQHDRPRSIPSSLLLSDANELLIHHNNVIYRLLHTRQGKLLLTK